MYRMPEKQTGSWTVSNCAQCCFYQYANHLPFRLLSIKLKYRGFLMTSRFAVFHFMLFLKRMNSFMWIYAFKREKLQGNVRLQPHAAIFMKISHKLAAGYKEVSLFTHTQLLNGTASYVLAWESFELAWNSFWLNKINPFAPELHVTTCADPHPFYHLWHHQF